MTTDFTSVMQQRSDRELAEILSVKRHEYQEAAIAAAQLEFDKRNLELNNFLTSQEMDAARQPIQAIPKENQKFSLLHKVLAFLAPGYISALWDVIMKYGFEKPFLKALSIPVVILIQVWVYHQLKKKGYSTLAKDFNKWTLNGWIFFVGLAVLLYLLETILKHIH